MKKYIVWLDKIRGKNMRALGGKALNLCQLRKIGVPVPLAFFLSTEAYRESIKDEKVQKELNELLRAQAAKNNAELVRIACSLREAIINTEIPEEVRREVLKSYHKLEVRRRAGELSCAVRSSATAEDLAGASFAGQYDTFLNVKEEEGLLLSIKKCWASLWTERAILYRERKGFKPSAEALAVIVQEMILSEQSGVVFTINPISGNKGEMLIEATWGLGESLVSGNVTPDNYIVDKATLEIKKKNINDKKLMSISDFKSEGTLEIEVPSERRRKQVLSDDKIRELANLASVIEEHYGEPQDIEWACHNGRFHILQSRPITTVKSVPKEIVQDKNDGTIWTTVNVGEVVPGVVTPLTWSLMMEPIGGDNFSAVLNRMGLRKYSFKLIERFYGRVWLNTSSYQAAMAILSLNRLSNHLRKLFHRSSFSREAIKHNLSCILMQVLVLGKTSLMALMLPRELRQFVPILLQSVENMDGLDLKDMSSEQIMRRIEEQLRLHGACVRHLHSCNILAEGFYSLLERIIEWRSQDNGVSTGQLVTGLAGMKSAEPSIEIWKISRLAIKSEKILRILVESDISQIQSRLSEFKEGRDFWEKFECFLDKYGHYTTQVYELMFPRWSDDPGFVLSVLKNYVSSGEDVNPLNFEKRQREVRAEATEKMMKALSDGFLNKLFPIKRLVFNGVTKATQFYSLWRENMKHYVTLNRSRVRRLYLELGARFSFEGSIAESQDIFFLTAREINRISKGELGEESITQLIEQRKQEREKDLAITPPKVIKGIPELGKKIVVEEYCSDVGLLRGIGTSPGEVTGKARVILDPMGSAKLKEGEILVAPATNPGWTPLFLTAGAVVTEIGGLLSHGSIVAREYGIPAVMNVNNVTKIIKDGQLLTVDGKEGTVYINPA